MSRPLAALASVVLTVLGLVALLPDCASACSCGDGSRQEIAKAALGSGSDAVFSGEVEVIDVERGPRAIGIFKERESSVVIQVSEVWKGPQHSTLEVHTLSDGAMCGYSFKEGQEYLVYAYGKEEPFKVDLCSQTKLLSKAGANLAVLGDGERPTGGDGPLGHLWGRSGGRDGRVGGAGDGGVLLGGGAACASRLEAVYPPSENPFLRDWVHKAGSVRPLRSKIFSI